MTTEFKSLKAQGAIAANLIIKPGTADGAAALATGPTDALLGSTDSLDKDDGEYVDLDLRPIAEVRLGGAVSYGQWLTANAASKAVVAAPAAGVNANVIGRAAKSGTAEEVIPYYRCPTQIQG